MPDTPNTGPSLSDVLSQVLDTLATMQTLLRAADIAIGGLTIVAKSLVHPPTDGPTWTPAEKVALIRRPEPEEPPGFAMWWSRYPSRRRSCKFYCLAKWRANGLEETSATIINALDQQIASDQWRKHDQKYVPRSRTYMSQRRWLDEPGEKTTKRRQSPGGSDTFDPDELFVPPDSAYLEGAQ